MHTSVPAQYERYRNIGVWRCEGDAHLSSHAQFVNCDHGDQIEEQSLRERLGQCNFGIPRTLKTHWRLIQGGVVDWVGGLGQWGQSRKCVEASRAIHERHDSPVIASYKCFYKERSFGLVHACVLSELSVIVLSSSHGSGAGIVPRRVVGFNSFRRRRSVPAKRVRRETSAESWSVRSSSMNCVRGWSTRNSSRNVG